MQAVLLQLLCPHCQVGNRMVVSAKNATPPRCGKCGQQLFTHFAVVFGYVYVLSNPAMPNLLKIGHTSGSLRGRVEQLSAATGVPRPFEVEAYFLAQAPRADEKLVHEALRYYRRPGREFFELELKEALVQCESVLGRRPHYLRSKHGAFREP